MNKKVTLTQNKLMFQPNPINYEYAITIHYLEKKLNINYEIECKYIKNIDPNTHLYSFNRKQIFINYQEPKGKIDQMTKNIYPIIAQITDGNDKKKSHKSSITMKSYNAVKKSKKTE